MSTYAAWEELLMAADLYANKCTQQEEKFDHYRRIGVPWTWADCQAAYEMLCAEPDRWELWTAWRKYKAFPSDERKGSPLGRATPPAAQRGEGEG